MCRQRNKEEGLEHLVSCPKELSVFETEQPANTFDLVLSQDSLLHCGNERHHAVLEAARILKPGGFLVFTDIMQSDNADPEVCPWPLAPLPSIFSASVSCPAITRYNLRHSASSRQDSLKLENSRPIPRKLLAGSALPAPPARTAPPPSRLAESDRTVTRLSPCFSQVLKSTGVLKRIQLETMGSPKVRHQIP